MKITSLLFAFLFIINSTFAQDMKLKYDIEIKSDDPEMQYILQLSKGSSLTIYAKDDKSRVEMVMGQLMKNTTILDNGKKKGLQLIDGMVGKQAAIIEGSDFEGFNAEEEDVKFEYLDETKTILGYKCKKAVALVDNQEMIYWYTNELKVSDVYLREYSKLGLQGVPLEYSINSSEASMKFVATEVKTNIDEKGLFDLKIPEGYTKKSFEEVSSMINF
ncbi:hypothetical protein [Brumimicrobium mesophilum]|uniref:hypothetical protein n=1 Tax=Brumimicrobium mesophilum TaxID=392717 RepID=UPI000D1447DD|nr:hypothetical protein [Brumimicrobium mesophilum]